MTNRATETKNWKAPTVLPPELAIHGHTDIACQTKPLYARGLFGMKEVDALGDLTYYDK